MVEARGIGVSTGFEMPLITRVEVLMCLVDRLGSVSRFQINDLAQVLRDDVEQGRLRPLAEVCREIATSWRTMQEHLPAILQDPVLGRTALSYTPREMRRKYSPTLSNAPAGALMRDLCALDQSGRVLLDEDDLPHHDDGIFYIRPTGKRQAEVIRAAFESINWEGFGNPLVVADTNGAALLPAPH